MGSLFWRRRWHPLFNERRPSQALLVYLPFARVAIHRHSQVLSAAKSILPPSLLPFFNMMNHRLAGIMLCHSCHALARCAQYPVSPTPLLLTVMAFVPCPTALSLSHFLATPVITTTAATAATQSSQKMTLVIQCMIEAFICTYLIWYTSPRNNSLLADNTFSSLFIAANTHIHAHSPGTQYNMLHGHVTRGMICCVHGPCVV